LLVFAPADVLAHRAGDDRDLRELPLLGEHRACRGTWARVTIDQFRHLALQTC
jgi:hypothetical protein